MTADDGVSAALAALDCVAAVQWSEGHYRIDLQDGAQLPEAVQAVAARIAPSRLELVRPTLEDIFIDIVTPGALQEAMA